MKSARFKLAGKDQSSCPFGQHTSSESTNFSMSFGNTDEAVLVSREDIEAEAALNEVPARPPSAATTTRAFHGKVRYVPTRTSCCCTCMFGMVCCCDFDNSRVREMTCSMLGL